MRRIIVILSLLCLAACAEVHPGAAPSNTPASDYNPISKTINGS